MNIVSALLLFGVSNGIPQNIRPTHPTARGLWVEDETNAGILSVNKPLTPVTSGSSMSELVLSQGYPLEEYEVVTEDGYILTVFRIPFGKNKTSSPRTPLLLQHGLFSTSASWVISEPFKGLGFVLADAGFDVWLSNSRGTTYSMKHIKYNPAVDKKEFFNYSFHEMGYYDLPAVIDLMLNKTGASQIIYVGHSQGTTEFYVMASTRPEYNSRVKVAAAMAPIAYFTHCRGTVKIIADFTGILAETAKLLGLYEVLSNSPLIHLFDTTLCRKSSVIESLCDNFLFALTGFDAQQFNESLIPLIVDQGPSGASIKQLTHFGQLANNGGKFSMYDYGSTGNRERYGQETPPEYDLTKITVPINLHYSLNDWLAGVEDVKKLHSRLTKSKLIQVPFPAFNHLDFMWAKDVRPLLYDNMIAMLETSARAGETPRRHADYFHKRSVTETQYGGKPAKSMVDYVVPEGYPLEEYDVVTEDGYILGIYRIPHGRNYSSTKRPPILLQHGILASSACFVMETREKSLGFILADAGFDVWLSNTRGNTYSKGHVTLDPVLNASKFYDYSFHELGYYDLPAVIDFILNKTGNSQLRYIGHSQGTTEFFVMASSRPEYNAKIKVATTMAPVVFLDNIRGAFKLLSKLQTLLDILNEYFGVNVIFKSWKVPKEGLLSPTSPIARYIFYNVLSLTGGYDDQQLNKTMLPLAMEQGSSGATVKQFRHFSQVINSGGKFVMFDYGRDENTKRYGQPTPPEYDLSKITAQVNLHYAKNDWISRVPDVQKLNRHLPNSKLYEVSFELFNHLDFLWAKDVNELLYNGMIKALGVDQNPEAAPEDGIKCKKRKPT
ncbi:hypothetical protein GE061_000348 [Apolygus lucorum]|uniref:Partial AB-hydrolase lipase domain-containing protein n=1 Tax=Apolygus lucorum TaxID=248454 RepID=A0A6A4KAA2_APOLU|nr:hypothetical protein GE061_000348 [Apolygus lucorum]